MLIQDFPPTPGVVKTAGLKNNQDLEADIPLEGTEIRRFRGGAARANYLAQDRADICYATKELCRRMHAPCKRDIVALERLVKYLASEPRLVLEYEWQATGNLQVYCDTDFAGCQVTRKSTSGGGAMFGKHLVKHWSSTQKVVTLSSGEAELYGVVKGATEALGLRSLAQDLGIAKLEIYLHADSSAAIGICNRSGIGKVRHLATGLLWVQERIRSKDLHLYKVLGTDNPADLLTKHLPRDAVDKHIAAFNTTRQGGRAESAPQLQGV